MLPITCSARDRLDQVPARRFALGEVTGYTNSRASRRAAAANERADVSTVLATRSAITAATLSACGHGALRPAQRPGPWETVRSRVVRPWTPGEVRWPNRRCPRHIRATQRREIQDGPDSAGALLSQ